MHLPEPGPGAKRRPTGVRIGTHRLGVRTGLAVVLTLGASGAATQQSAVLFAHKQWRVCVVDLTNGVYGCGADVASPGDSFSI